MAELIWDGKYDAHGNKRAPVRIELPFQTVETVNESAQERQRTLELSASGADPEWRNRLIWGDKKYVLPSLLPEFAGKVDLIYIDPPFDTGADFSFSAKIPNSDEEFTKQPSVIEQKAYRDTWGRGLQSYLHWFAESATMLKDLLSEAGVLYVHLDWHVAHYAKVVLDEMFGDENFRSEIIWKRTTAHSDAATYGQNHDTILFYSKSEKLTWNNPKTKYEDWYIERYYRYRDSDGRRFMSDNLSASGLSGGGYKYAWKGISGNWRCPQSTMARLDAEGRIFYTENGVPRFKRYLDEMEGVPLQSLWDDVQSVVSWSPETTGFDTQKPEALLERIIKASSKEHDLVLDCFCGSGTTAAVAEKLNRRWIACDLGRFAIHTTRKRLLRIPGVKPFVVQNLGKYERQAWQVAEFAPSPLSSLDSAGSFAGERSCGVEGPRARRWPAKARRGVLCTRSR